MQYTDRDLDTEERNAWQRGDYATAEALAALIAAEEDATRADDLQNVVDNIRERITEANWRTGKKAELRAALEALEAMVSDMEVGGRNADLTPCLHDIGEDA